MLDERRVLKSQVNSTNDYTSSSCDKCGISFNKNDNVIQNSNCEHLAHFSCVVNQCWNSQCNYRHSKTDDNENKVEDVVNKCNNNDNRNNMNTNEQYTCPKCKKRGFLHEFYDSSYNKRQYQGKHVRCLCGINFCIKCNHWSKYHKKLDCEQVGKIFSQPRTYTMCPNCYKIVYNTSINHTDIVQCSQCNKLVCFRCEEKNIAKFNHDRYCKRTRYKR